MKITETRCDRCGKLLLEPHALLLRSVAGEGPGYDLCRFCEGMLIEVIRHPDCDIEFRQKAEA